MKNNKMSGKNRRKIAPSSAFLLALISLILGWVLPAKADIRFGIELYEAGNFAAAFDEFSPLAEAGDPHIQNFLGFMLYHGEGVQKDPVRAHDLFHEAAEKGVVDAMRNLGILHSKGAKGVPQNFTEASLWFLRANAARKMGNKWAAPNGPVTVSSYLSLPKQLEPALKLPRTMERLGERTYMMFCSGCHGFNGIAAYPLAPSIAFGDRMYKDDNALVQSVLDGKGRMPGWQNKLPQQIIAKAVGYMRALSISFRRGDMAVISQQNIPKYIFRFRPVGEKGEIWWPSPYQ